jgi:hypothetical protein
VHWKLIFIARNICFVTLVGNPMPQLRVSAGSSDADWEALGHRREWVSVTISETPGLPSRMLVRVEAAPDGRLICTGLILAATGNPAPKVVIDRRPEGELEVLTGRPGPRSAISARGLRKLPLAHILAGLVFDPTVLEQWRQLGIVGQNARPRVRPGPKGHSPGHYSAVIAAYRRALQEAPASPVKRLAELWPTPEGKPTPEPTIRRWLKVTRETYGLEPASRGRPRQQPRDIQTPSA